MRLPCLLCNVLARQEVLAGLLVCLLMMAIFYSNSGSWKSFTLLLPLMRM